MTRGGATSSAYDDAVSFLASGGVVAAATETLFGLLADASRSECLDRVFFLKGRDAGRTVALLLPCEGAWERLVVEVPASARALSRAFWPGPLTIALAARPGLDSRLVEDGFVAARWPADAPASRIAASFGSPVTATSANVAGQPAATTAEQVATAFGSPVREGRLVVVPGTAPGGLPSTVVRVRGEHVELIRAGAVAASELEAALGRPLVGARP